MRALLVSLLLLAAAGPEAFAARLNKQDDARIRQFVIKYKNRQHGRASALPAAMLQRLRGRAGVAVQHLRPMSGDQQVFEFDAPLTPEEAQALTGRLAADPDIEWAEPSRPQKALLVPNDPQYGTQWHYHPAANEIAGINAPAAWDITTGSPTIRVAVLDTGYRGHGDLISRIVGGTDLITDVNTANDGGGRDTDASDPGDFITAVEDAGGVFLDCCSSAPGGQACSSSWHGTHVAGTVGAVTNNGSAVSGVNWVSQIVPVRVLGKCGNFGNTDIADGIRWAAGIDIGGGVPVNANPARVINLSLGSPVAGACSATYQTAIDAAVAQGAVVVVAAGNSGADANFEPGNCSNVITVGAVRRDGGYANYSNFGPALEISAPGGQLNSGFDIGVLSTLNTGLTVPAADTTVAYQGTSMAAPHVAGVVSLMLSVAPTMPVATVMTEVQRSTRPFPVSPNQCFDSGASSCGAGMIDAHKAVLQSRPVTQSPASLSATTLAGNQVAFSWSAVNNAASYNLYNSLVPGQFIANEPTTSRTVTAPGANNLLGIVVKGRNAFAGEGPGGTSPSTYTFALPIGGAVNVVPHITSVTVQFTACTATLPDLPCAGYSVQASPNAGFTAPVTQITVTNPAATQIQVPGLSSLTPYYVRLGTLNTSGGVGTYTNAAPFPVTTLNPLQQPGSGAPLFADDSQSQLRYNWTQGGNDFGNTYTADASTAAGFGGGATLHTVSGANLFTGLFTGLLTNASYYFRVRAEPNGPYLVSGPTATLAALPDGGTAAFSQVAANSARLSWGAGTNPPGTIHLAQLSPNADFSPPLISSATRNLFADLGGLGANTAYFSRLAAISHANAQTAFVAGPSTTTLALPPGALAATALSAVSIRASFVPNAGNPAGTRHLVQAALSAAFTALVASSNTANGFADFSGLLSHQTYYFQAAALNAGGAASAFTSLGFVATDPAQPNATVPTASDQTVASLRRRWDPNGNAPGTPYTAELDDDSLFGSIDQTSTTLNAFAEFAGLAVNTQYFTRVRALGIAPSPNSAARDLGGAFTATPPPGAVAPAFITVSYASATVQWGAVACSGYRVEAARDAAFTTGLLSANAGAAATQGGVTGLSDDATYYFRVGALNPDGAPNYLVLGSTRTRAKDDTVIAFANGGVSTTVAVSFSPIRSVQVIVPPGALPVGSLITLNLSVELDLPAPGTNQSVTRALGNGLGFQIDAQGFQPSKPVQVVVAYDPALLPLGADPKTIQLARFHEGARQWTFLATQVDTANRRIHAVVDHFSFFAPFLVTAGTALDAARIFPIPWQPGTGDDRFNASRLTIANVPAGARVRAVSILGELIWEGSANGAGVASWDGLNVRGSKAGSGTYLLIIEAEGERIVRRAVLTR